VSNTNNNTIASSGKSTVIDTYLNYKGQKVLVTWYSYSYLYSCPVYSYSYSYSHRVYLYSYLYSYQVYLKHLWIWPTKDCLRKLISLLSIS